MNELIQFITVMELFPIFAIILHEAAHGYVARIFGDPTAWQPGRVTLNPVKHIDLVGTILVPLGILLMSKLAGAPPLLFGWAKAGAGRFRPPTPPQARHGRGGAGRVGIQSSHGYCLGGFAALFGLQPEQLLGANGDRDRTGQSGADGAQSVSLAAAGWQAYRVQPIAAPPGVAIRQA